ncbi:baseplate J protein [Rubrivivax gelatinosus]|nr:baseplate J/gp47 family protein [Rubrivivax gelatinosus]MBK1613378.1 baseplate J protein [Rubrivivax gelatinosus]
MTTPLSVPIPSIEELTQQTARLLQQSLAQAAQTARPAELSAVDLELARSNIKALAFAQAVGLHGAYAYLRDFIARQAVPSTSEKEFLDGWLQTYRMARKAAAAASGVVQGAGVNGTLLPAGTLLQVDDGRQYRVQSDVAVAGGVVTATVIAVEPGAAGNVAGGATLNLISPVTGIDSGFTVNATSGLSGGADIESDAGAVYRLQQRLANEPLGGAPADYARWALQVPSITRAWGVRNPAGPTTAGVIIMADANEPEGLPTLAQRDQVLAYILDPRRGPPDELFVIIPKLKTISFTVAVSPDTTAIRNAINAALTDLFFREAVPGGSIPHTHAVEAISGVVGEYNHQIVAPVVSVGGFFTTSAFDELLALGPVAFA